MASNPQEFYKIELSRALKENAFGLKRYQLISPVSAPESYSAYARVELVEGLTVFLRLTHCGYEVSGSSLTLFTPFSDRKVYGRLFLTPMHLTPTKAHRWRYPKV